ncbi:hypothetical protein ACOSP7_009962 [Xanthoceras sorbifolium]
MGNSIAIPRRKNNRSKIVLTKQKLNIMHNISNLTSRNRKAIAQINNTQSIRSHNRRKKTQTQNQLYPLLNSNGFSKFHLNSSQKAFGSNMHQLTFTVPNHNAHNKGTLQRIQGNIYIHFKPCS